MTGKEMTEIVSSKGGTSWLWYLLGGAVVAGGAAVLLLPKDKETTEPPKPLPTSPEFPQ
jgi:hypothetical protein